MTLKQVQSLVLWLRREKISYTHLSAGGVVLDGVVDGKLAEDAKPVKEEPKPTMYQKFGGDLVRQPLAKPSEVTPDEAVID